MMQEKSKRIAFLDLARGLAILFMVWQHGILVFCVESGEESAFGILLLLLGTAPAAPMFMFLMGLFFGRSPKSIVVGVKRGLMLLLLGYLLNFFRGYLPFSFFSLLGPTIGEAESPLSHFLEVDILQLAGLSLIALSLMHRLLSAHWLIGFVLSIIICVVSPWLWGLEEIAPGTSILWGVGGKVYFPFFPWVIYPIMGMSFGRFLFCCSDQKRLMRSVFQVGLGVGFVGILASFFISNRVFLIGDYMRSGLGVHTMISGFILVWLTICWLIVEKTPRNRLFDGLYFWSRWVTVIYFVQWILYGWLGFVLGFNEHGAVVAFLFGNVVLIVSHLLTKMYVRLSKKAP
ncbi:MAG: DUF1624 domain-containing protein [Planctomycetes bacterium]|nr:DUF1624 domain-containing protein [Planctomycetota bacterium]